MAWLRAFALALVGSGAGCSLVLGFDDRLMDAVNGGDTSSPDAAGLPIDAGADRNEVNNTSLTATPIEPGTYEDLTISPDSDLDWFSFTTPGQADVTIDVLYTYAYGDIDVQVYDTVSPLAIDGSASIDDDEHITMDPQPAAGTYFIKVYSNRGENFYDLILAVTGGPPPPDAATDAVP